MNYKILTFTGSYNVTTTDITEFCNFINAYVNNNSSLNSISVEDEYTYYLYNFKVYKVKNYNINKTYNITSEDIISDIQIDK